jgi:hypothetical protein
MAQLLQWKIDSVATLSGKANTIKFVPQLGVRIRLDRKMPMGVINHFFTEERKTGSTHVRTQRANDQRDMDLTTQDGKENS